MTYALWIVQVLLALLFLFSGGAKLVLSPEELLKGPVVLPVLFLRFIGVCEVLGALGLILPGLLRIRPGLTPLAAAGLVIIMIGATVQPDWRRFASGVDNAGGGAPFGVCGLRTPPVDPAMTET
ncbi:MAG: DoxX family protein [Acidobacteriota bacterium]